MQFIPWIFTGVFLVFAIYCRYRVAVAEQGRSVADELCKINMQHAVEYSIALSKSRVTILRLKAAVNYAKVRLIPYEAENMDNLAVGRSVK